MSMFQARVTFIGTLVIQLLQVIVNFFSSNGGQL